VRLVVVKDLRISGIEMSQLTETDVHALVRGVYRKTRLAVEIKAVTYHNLDIVRKRGSFEASIIFDL